MANVGRQDYVLSFKLYFLPPAVPCGNAVQKRNPASFHELVFCQFYFEAKLAGNGTQVLSCRRR